MSSIKQVFEQQSRVFITGTDTEVGKTYVTCLLTRYLIQAGLSVFPLKPISAGVEADGINQDAREIFNACEQAFGLNQINPIVYSQPIAPHIAAELAGERLTKKRLTKELTHTQGLAKLTLIEGAGGWLLPLNETELMSDWVAEQQMPVVLVVGVKLGCLNHALLTAQAIQASGCKLLGWVANFIEEENEISRKNVDYLQQKLNFPCLFEVAKNQTALA